MVSENTKKDVSVENLPEIEVYAFEIDKIDVKVGLFHVIIKI